MMRMVLKMAAASTVALLLLCCCCSAVASTDSKCDLIAAVGDNITVPLNHALETKDSLTWKYNNKDVLLYKKGQVIITGSKEDVSVDGSLKLTNVMKTKEGLYTPEINDKNGQKINGLKSTNLCVLDRVPVPSVTTQCMSDSVKFTCTVTQDKSAVQPKGLVYKWLQNGNVLNEEKTMTLTRTAKEVETDSFSCKVSNEASSGSSAPATQVCFKRQPIFPVKIFGIDTWIVVGSGAGIVVVLIVFVIVYCILTKRKRRMRLKDEGELRLAWTNEQDQHPHQHPPDQHHLHHNHPPDQRYHHHHHQQQQQQQPAGHTGPRQPRSKQHRDRQLPRTPDPPNGHPQPSPRRPTQAPRPVNNGGEEKPPPLPQPRKKAAKAPRV